MKKFAKIISIWLLVLLCSVSVAQAAAFTPGTYEASANGMMGAVKVQVSFTEDAIESVTVVEQNETPSIAQPALDKLPALIVGQQSVAVDTIAGATMTSNAILTAVKDCVEQAGGDVQSLMIQQTAKEVTLTAEELHTQVVVIGAGGAGLTAAVAAAEQGAQVIVVEKMGSVGGTTALSSGLVQVAGTQQQADAGITGDSWEIYAQDIYTRGACLGNKAIIDVICRNANSMMDWMTTHGIVWNPQIQQKHGEDVTYLRTVAPIAPEGFSGALGGVFTQTLGAEAERLGVSIMLDTKAEQILTQDGAAVGILAKNAEAGISYTIHADAVIVATGGFAANSEMAHAYDPTFPADNTDYRAFSGSLGEGIRMGQEAGAAVVDMEYMKILLSSEGPTVSASDAMYVNTNGERFAAEDLDTQNMAYAINRQPDSHCYMIYDSTAVDTSTQDVAAMIEAGSVIVADTLPELAEKLGMDAAALDASAAAFNAIVRGEAADPYGRTKFGCTIEEGPFYASERHTRLHYTMGGLKIDENAHVLDTQGSIIPGLYAAGETTGGIHGNYRVGANALSDILVMGRIAGSTAVSELSK